MPNEDKDEYPGMRNPYHLADLEDQKNEKPKKDWKNLSTEDKEKELVDSLKSKYPDIAIGSLFDPEKKSPLYPWLENR